MDRAHRKLNIVRAAALLVLCALVLPLLGALPAAAENGTNASGNTVIETLGSISECSFDAKTQTVTVSGTVYHKVFTASKYNELALYRVMPWENAGEVLAHGEPIARAPMSLRFTFSVRCPSISDRVCMFAVAALSDDGRVQLLTFPEYYASGGKPTDALGFKGVCTPNDADAIDSGAGTAVVDIFLDRLASSRHSGFIFRFDGMNYYFDRDYIEELDTVIRSYYASGADVLARLMVTPDGRDVSFAAGASLGFRYRGIVISDAESLAAVYAYTYFIASRYASSEYGKLSGVILGRAAADAPELGFTGLSGDAYAENFATVLTVVGAAVGDAVGRNTLSLIIPVGDRMSPDRVCAAESFLFRVGDVLSQHTDLSVTVMLESTHNPYGLTDTFFNEDDDEDDDEDEDEGEGEGEGEGEIPDEPGEDLPEDPGDEPTEDPGEEPGDDPGEEPGEEPMPIPDPNLPDAGFVCTDTIGYFEIALTRIRTGRSCFSPGFMLCWYPDDNTCGSALSVCYAYNYLCLATEGLNCFIVSFDDSGDDIFYRISHLFKSISSDEENNSDLTQYARSVFGTESWGDLFDGYSDSTGVYEKNSVQKLTDEFPGLRGTSRIWDFSERSGTQSWYAGFGCSTLKSVSSGGVRSLRAHLSDPGADVTAAVTSGKNYADIGFIFDTADPILNYDCLAFDLCAGEADGTLFEVKIVVYSDKLKLDASALIPSGERTVLYADTGVFPEGTKPHAIRVCVRRINGTGNYDLNLYGISVGSYEFTNAQLEGMIEADRSEIRTNEKSESEKKRPLAGAIAVFAASAAAVVAVPVLLDRREKKKREGGPAAPDE